MAAQMDENSAPKDRKFVEALARGLELLRAFSDSHSVLGNQELSAITGLPKATVSRMTYTLKQLGYLSNDPHSDKYRLDAGVLALGYAYVANVQVSKLIQPLMEKFAKQHQVSVGLTVRERLSMIYVENCRHHAVQSLRVEIGSSVPLATSAAGRAYLASLGTEERAEFINYLNERQPEDWQQKVEAIDASVASYQTKGYCLSLGDWNRTVNAVAVPFQVQGGKTMVLSIGGPSYLVSLEQIEHTFAPQLLHLVEEINNMRL